MKTLDEFLDYVCLRDHQHYWIMRHRRSNEQIINMMREAAELYAQQYRSEYDDQRNRINSLLSAESDLKAENSRLLGREAKLIEDKETALELAKLRGIMSLYSRLEAACGRMKVNNLGKWIELDDFIAGTRIAIGFLEDRLKKSDLTSPQ